MNPQRIAVKFFVQPDPSAEVNHEPFTALFHHFIQEKSVPGLLLDVADYAHVPNGPGIILIGHEVDYGIDQVAGLAGLLVVRKHFGEASFAEVLKDTLHKALVAIQGIEKDGRTGLSFGLSAVEVQVLDRRVAPNDAEHFEAASAEAAPVLEAVFGETSIEREGADDPRRALSFQAKAASAGPIADLIARASS